VRIAPDDLRRHYESLSDEGLLDIDRSGLTPVALGIYDQEIARRGLTDTPTKEDGEDYHDSLPAFRRGVDWDLDSDTDEGPQPVWLESAACPWSAHVHPSVDYVGTGAEVQTALREAGIPSRIVVKPPEPEPPWKPRSLYCVMVPGELGMRATNVVERTVFNPMAVAEWRSQLQALSDEELRALNPEDCWGGLIARAESMKRAYLDEIASRSLRAPAKSQMH